MGSTPIIRSSPENPQAAMAWGFFLYLQGFAGFQNGSDNCSPALKTLHKNNKSSHETSHEKNDCRIFYNVYNEERS